MGNMVSFRTTGGENLTSIHEVDGVWYITRNYQSPAHPNLGSYSVESYPSKEMAESYFRILVKFYLGENRLTQEKADEVLKQAKEL